MIEATTQLPMCIYLQVRRNVHCEISWTIYYNEECTEANGEGNNRPVIFVPGLKLPTFLILPNRVAQPKTRPWGTSLCLVPFHVRLLVVRQHKELDKRYKFKMMNWLFKKEESKLEDAGGLGGFGTVEDLTTSDPRRGVVASSSGPGDNESSFSSSSSSDGESNLSFNDDATLESSIGGPLFDESNYSVGDDDATVGTSGDPDNSTHWRQKHASSFLSEFLESNGESNVKNKPSANRKEVKESENIENSISCDDSDHSSKTKELSLVKNSAKMIPDPVIEEDSTNDIVNSENERPVVSDVSHNESSSHDEVESEDYLRIEESMDEPPFPVPEICSDGVEIEAKGDISQEVYEAPESDLEEPRKTAKISFKRNNNASESSDSESSSGSSQNNDASESSDSESSLGSSRGERESHSASRSEQSKSSQNSRISNEMEVSDANVDEPSDTVKINFTREIENDTVLSNNQDSFSGDTSDSHDDQSYSEGEDSESNSSTTGTDPNSDAEHPGSSRPILPNACILEKSESEQILVAQCSSSSSQSEDLSSSNDGESSTRDQEQASQESPGDQGSSAVFDVIHSSQVQKEGTSGPSIFVKSQVIEEGGTRDCDGVLRAESPSPEDLSLVVKEKDQERHSHDIRTEESSFGGAVSFEAPVQENISDSPLESLPVLEPLSIVSDQDKNRFSIQESALSVGKDLEPVADNFNAEPTSSGLSRDLGNRCSQPESKNIASFKLVSDDLSESKSERIDQPTDDCSNTSTSSKELRATFGQNFLQESLEQEEEDDERSKQSFDRINAAKALLEDMGGDVAPSDDSSSESDEDSASSDGSSMNSDVDKPRVVVREAPLLRLENVTAKTRSNIPEDAIARKRNAQSGWFSSLFASGAKPKPGVAQSTVDTNPSFSEVTVSTNSASPPAEMDSKISDSPILRSTGEGIREESSEIERGLKQLDESFSASSSNASESMAGKTQVTRSDQSVGSSVVSDSKTEISNLSQDDNSKKFSTPVNPLPTLQEETDLKKAEKKRKKKEKKLKKKLSSHFKKGSLKKVNRHGDEVSVGTINRTSLGEGTPVLSNTLNPGVVENKEDAQVVRPWNSVLVKRRESRRKKHPISPRKIVEEPSETLDVLNKFDEMTASFDMIEEQCEDEIPESPSTASSERNTHDDQGNQSNEAGSFSSRESDSSKENATEELDQLTELQNLAAMETLIDEEKEENFDDMWETVSIDHSIVEAFETKQSYQIRLRKEKAEERVLPGKPKKDTAENGRLRIFKVTPLRTVKRGGKRKRIAKIHDEFDDTFKNALKKIFDDEESSQSESEDIIKSLQEDKSRNMYNSDAISVVGGNSVTSLFVTGREMQRIQQAAALRKNAIEDDEDSQSGSENLSNAKSSSKMARRRKKVDPAVLFKEELNRQTKMKKLSVKALRQEMVDRRGTSVNLLQREFTAMRRSKKRPEGHDEFFDIQPRGTFDDPNDPFATSDPFNEVPNGGHESDDQSISVKSASTTGSRKNRSLGSRSGSKTRGKSKNDGLSTHLSRWHASGSISDLDDLRTVQDAPQSPNLLSSPVSPQEIKKRTGPVKDLPRIALPAVTEERDEEDEVENFASFGDFGLSTVQEAEEEENELGLLSNGGNAHGTNERNEKSSRFLPKIEMKLKAPKISIPKLGFRNKGGSKMQSMDSDWGYSGGLLG